MLQKIDEVRRLLYIAEGFYNLGDFDQSLATYGKVLQLDRYNKAARRGMERNNARISDYAGAARDQARAEMLAQADSGWELKQNNVTLAVDNGFIGEEALGDNSVSINQKLDSIVIPFVDFDDSTLEDAIEFLQGRSRTLDPEIIEVNKGVDFVLNMGTGNSPEIAAILDKTFSLRLRNVPLRQVLDFVTRQTGTTFRVDRFAVVVQPAGGATNDLFVRRYSVAPNFLSQAATRGSSADLDPFGEDENAASKLAPRLTAKEYLQQQGVPFPDGASASYNPGLSQLIVKTTSLGHDDVQQLVAAQNLKEPVSIIIESKIVSISQENLDEIGFDTTLQALTSDDRLLLSGGTTSNGRASDFIAGQPVSSGLRSGDFATGADPIADVLNRTSRQIPNVFTGFDGTSSQSEVEDDTSGDLNSAPGVLSVIGQVNDTGLTVLLRALDQKKGTDIVAQPSVITRSGQQATVESVREFIYPTEYEPPEVPNDVANT